MDPSIADILDSVTRSHNATAAGFSDTAQQQHDLQLLSQAWVAERVAPELLPYPAELMERTMTRMRVLRHEEDDDKLSGVFRDRQIEKIEESTAQMEASSSFGLIVMQTELERFKFLVRSFLRSRIAKIDAHLLHILALHNGSTASQDGQRPLLSATEASYAHTHAALLERHYNSSFLSSFPPKLRRLDDRTGVGMVEGPDLEQAVFVRCLGIENATNGAWNRRYRGLDEEDEMDDNEPETFGAVDVSCGFSGSAEDEQRSSRSARAVRSRDEGGEKIVSMRRGEIWIVRWSGVKDAVARGECELI
ncbi:MAG: GINS complex subunit [Chrysothrix sp. TS-e1954]|nr:MAG: GINS complex subunit [Chrysothrix sp. TS-e1954]